MDASLVLSLFRVLRTGFVALVLAILVSAHFAVAADLTISPTTGSYAVGQQMTATIVVNSADQAMNAASGVILFPKDTVEVVALSKVGSIISLWVQEPFFSNTDGVVRFEGVVLNPGYTGANGKILSITFRAKAAGNAMLSIDTSFVLANDGKGTNILIKSVPASYTIGGASSPAPTSPSAGIPVPEVVSTSHPDQQSLYALPDVRVSWQNPSGVTAVRVWTNQDPNTIPTNTYAPPISEKTLTDIPDGVRYFHAQFRTSAGWGPSTHFRYQIDTAKPTNITAEQQVDGLEAGTVRLAITALDDRSGIQKYIVEENGKILTEKSATASTTIDIQGLSAGAHTLRVRALDGAGNAIEKDIEVIATAAPIKEVPVAPIPTETTPPRTAFNYLWALCIVIGLIVILLFSVGLWFLRGKPRTRTPQPPKKADTSDMYSDTRTIRELQEVISAFHHRVDALENNTMKGNVYQDELVQIQKMKTDIDTMQLRLKGRIDELERKMSLKKEPPRV